MEATSIYVLSNGKALRGTVRCKFDQAGRPFAPNFVTVDSLAVRFRSVRTIEYGDTETYGYLFVEVAGGALERFALQLAQKEIERYGFKFQ